MGILEFARLLASLAIAAIVLVAIVTVVTVLIYFPFYVLLFIPRRLKASKIGPGAGPSIVTLALYCLVAFMTFLAAAPSFLQLAAKRKQSEAKQNLGAIFTCQVAYFGEENTYGGGPRAFNLINWAPEGRNMYAYYCGDDMFENTKGSEPPQIKNGPDWPYSVRPGAADTGFTCVALGNIDSDDFLDVWSINDDKVLANVHNDLHNDNPSKAPLVLAILLPILLLSFWRDYRNNKKALAKFNEQETQKSAAEVNEAPSKP